MKKIFLPALIFVVFISNSCKKTTTKSQDSVIACFSKSTDMVGNGQTINFTNCSKNYDHVEWDFGDGHSSTISEPSHVWEKNGVYTVALTVYGKDNTSNKTTQTVVVGYKPNMDLKVAFSNWPSVAFPRETVATLIRSTDKSSIASIKTPSNGVCTGFNIYTFGSNFPVAQQDHICLPDAYSPFQIKISIISDPIDGSEELRDSLITDIITTTGAKTSTGSANLSFVTVSYTFSPVSYY